MTREKFRIEFRIGRSFRCLCGTHSKKNERKSRKSSIKRAYRRNFRLSLKNHGDDWEFPSDKLDSWDVT